MRVLKALLVSLPLFSAVAMAEELQTDWIEPKEGYEEDTLGARMGLIETLPEGEGQKITISIPKASLEDNRDITEIRVVGRRPDKTELDIPVRHEWATDYEGDYYGLVLYIGENSKLPLRLYLKGQDAPGRP